MHWGILHRSHQSSCLSHRLDSLFTIKNLNLFLWNFIYLLHRRVRRCFEILNYRIFSWGKVETFQNLNSVYHHKAVEPISIKTQLNPLIFSAKQKLSILHDIVRWQLYHCYVTVNRLIFNIKLPSIRLRLNGEYSSNWFLTVWTGNFFA